MRPSCAGCQHLVKPREQWCSAPQLVEVLDRVEGRGDMMVEAHAAREFKAACGHDARWHSTKKELDHGR